MGKVSVVQFEGFDTTPSLIKWGLFRKWRYGQDFISVTGAAFVPKYELAVFTCGSFSMPEAIFYFSSEKIALLRFDEIKAAIEQGGTCGEPIRDIVREGPAMWDFFPLPFVREEVLLSPLRVFISLWSRPATHPPHDHNLTGEDVELEHFI